MWLIICIFKNHVECGGVVVEHQTLNREVLDSIPTDSTMLFDTQEVVALS